MNLFKFLFDTKQQEQVQQTLDLLSDEVSHRVTAKLQDEFTALAEVEQATQKVIDLQKEVALLKAEKSNIEEGFNRKEREIEHKTGLLRLEIEAQKQQDQKSFGLQVQEAKLAARESALVERQKMFEDKMSFIEKRFTEEVGYLKDMVGDMAKRLPNATILATKDL